MKKLNIKIFAAAILMIVLSETAAVAEDGVPTDKEYQIKAAFLYNFVKFVDWPEEKMGDGDKPITIGIIGKDPFGKIFEALKDKKIKGKNVVISRFKSFEELKKTGNQNPSEFETQISNIRKCHVLFICSSEEESIKEIINLTEKSSVLTVSETANFLENGGIINFLVEEKKVRFEVNLDASDKAKLKISSQLLQLAKRVLRQK